jgi:hypothetical protein
MIIDNVQHLPSQGKSKEHEDLWLGQTTDNIEKLPVPSLLVPSLPNIGIGVTL